MVSGLLGGAKKYQRSYGESMMTINGLHVRSGSLRKGHTPVLWQRACCGRMPPFEWRSLPTTAGMRMRMGWDIVRGDLRMDFF